MQKSANCTDYKIFCDLGYVLKIIFKLVFEQKCQKYNSVDKYTVL